MGYTIALRGLDRFATDAEVIAIGDARYVLLDQTSPQTVTGGLPIFYEGFKIGGKTVTGRGVETPAQIYTSQQNIGGNYFPTLEFIPNVAGGTFGINRMRHLAFMTFGGKPHISLGDYPGTSVGGGLGATDCMWISPANEIVICAKDGSSRSKYWAQSTGHSGLTPTNPVLYIQSADYNQSQDYVRFYHDQTDAYIEGGNGSLYVKSLNNVIIKPGSTDVIKLSAWNDNGFGPYSQVWETNFNFPGTNAAERGMCFSSTSNIIFGPVGGGGVGPLVGPQNDNGFDLGYERDSTHRIRWRNLFLAGYIFGGTGTNVTIKLGDAVGVNKLSITDSANIEVSSITSDGVSTILNSISTVAIGTSPYACTSTTLNTNLNADLLDGQHGSYYEPAITKYDLTGTTNQVVLSDSGVGVLLARNITLSLPQDIATTSSPTFAGIILGGQTSDPITPTDGTFWYRSDTDEFRARANGTTYKLTLNPV